MNAFTNYLEKMGSNFLVSAMVPSLAFVIVSILLFNPILKIDEKFSDSKGIYQLIGFSIIIFISTVIVGFTLTALNTFVLKIFEGYVKIPFLWFLYKRSQNIHRKKARDLMLDRDNLKCLIRRLEQLLDQNADENSDLDELKDKYYQIVNNYNMHYPQDLGDVLPTRFGNTLKAAENYPGERYGFDGVQIWPRLIQVIPDEYKISIDSVRNELSFLVNMAILSIFFSFLCLLAIGYTMWASGVTVGGPVPFKEFSHTTVPYLWGIAFGFISGGFFYNASILSVSSFSLMIRSSFDLFRLDLLKKLGVKKPVDSIEEFHIWQNINELIVMGSHSLTYQKVDYSEDQS